MKNKKKIKTVLSTVNCSQKSSLFSWTSYYLSQQSYKMHMKIYGLYSCLLQLLIRLHELNTLVHEAIHVNGDGAIVNVDELRDLIVSDSFTSNVRVYCSSY